MCVWLVFYNWVIYWIYFIILCGDLVFCKGIIFGFDIIIDVFSLWCVVWVFFSRFRYIEKGVRNESSDIIRWEVLVDFMVIYDF